jgi:hypothetical protein
MAAVFNPFEPGDLSFGYQFAGEQASQAESQQSQLTGDWQNQESNHSELEEDLQLNELMENVKRYIRNIDISDL